MTNVITYKQKEFGHRHIHVQDDMKTKGEDSHLQAKERNLEKSLSSHPSEEPALKTLLILDLDPRTVGKYLLVKLPSLGSLLWRPLEI